MIHFPWTEIALILGFLASLLVISKREKVPSITLAWVLSFFLLPYAGIILYTLVGYRKRVRTKKLKPLPLKKSIPWIKNKPYKTPTPPEILTLSRLAENLTGFPLLEGNRLCIFENAYETYGAFGKAIALAKHHIHLEYYIFQPDETGLYFRDLLIKKAKEGIECRLLVDPIGSFWLNRRFLDPLKKAGVQFAYFSPVKLSRPWGFQLRNHRKLIIIDGKKGLIGSQNIGNEYLQWKKRKLSWRDVFIEIEGPGVLQLQSIFAQDWEFTTQENIYNSNYFPEQSYHGASAIQTLPTGPDDTHPSLELILNTLIYSAKRKITLLTPYFIPNFNLELTLQAAAQRGVQVEIIIPSRSDQWIVDLAARSWFYELLSSGIKIYEFDKTFVHAKVLTIDDTLSLIGSANMDERSFKINFECSLLIYDTPITQQLVSSFEEIKSQSKLVSFAQYKNQSFLKNLRDGILRILSPLL